MTRLYVLCRHRQHTPGLRSSAGTGRRRRCFGECRLLAAAKATTTRYGRIRRGLLCAEVREHGAERLFALLRDDNEDDTGLRENGMAYGKADGRFTDRAAS